MTTIRTKSKVLDNEFIEEPECPCDRLNSTASLSDLYHLSFEDARQFSASVIDKHLPMGAGSVSADDFVSNAYLKIWAGEEAIKRGHAELRNRKIQIKPEYYGSDKVQLYSGGLRHWDRSKHSFNSFLHLAIVSDMRNHANKQRKRGVIGRKEIALGGTYSKLDVDSLIDKTNPEKDAADSLAKAALIEALDVNELKHIASLILHHKYGIMDVAFELGLTRSQVQKRILKIKETAVKIAANK